MISKAKRAYIALGVVLAAVASVALAGTFNLFSPATGILKGNSSTYVTTAANSLDVRGLWTGTCNASSFLRGDGACAAVGTGTVTSVALTMPTGFSVSGSPITTSGTLGITTTLNGVLHGNGSGFTASNVALGSEVSGTLPVANGGTGATTLTGVLHGNGASAFTAANVSLTSEVTGTLPVANGGTNLTTATDDAALVGNGTTWQAAAIPNCGSSTQALAYSTSTNSFSCQTVTGSGGASGANPTASVGLTAVNGVASTFLRSDGAPALDQSIAPTWTGLHSFTPSASNVTAITITNSTTSVTGLRVNNNGTNNAEVLINTTTAGDSYLRTTNLSGTNWSAGNRRSDNAYVIANATDLTTAKVSVTTAGVLNATGGVQVNGTDVCQSNGTNCPSSPTSGTYTATLSTGCTTTPTVTVKWAKTGNLVVLNFGNLGTCTSNTSIVSFDASVPAGIRPASNQCVQNIAVEDNSVLSHATGRVLTTGVVDFGLDGNSGGNCSGAGWTASGTKSLGNGFSLVYQTAN